MEEAPVHSSAAEETQLLSDEAAPPMHHLVRERCENLFELGIQGIGRPAAERGHVDVALQPIVATEGSAVVGQVHSDPFDLVADADVEGENVAGLRIVEHELEGREDDEEVEVVRQVGVELAADRPAGISVELAVGKSAVVAAVDLEELHAELLAAVGGGEGADRRQREVGRNTVGERLGAPRRGGRFGRRRPGRQGESREHRGRKRRGGEPASPARLSHSVALRSDVLSVGGRWSRQDRRFVRLDR